MSGMGLDNAIQISAAGMKAQGTRIKVVAENMANSDSTAEAPGDLPYRRKVVTFKNELDRNLGTKTVRVASIGVDRSPFGRIYSPGHPVADADGYVLKPNVDGVIESQDLNEAQRSYEANITVIENTKAMMMKTMELLKS